LADGSEGVDRVSRKSAHRLCYDEVDFSVQCVSDHALKALPVFRVGSRDSFIYVNGGFDTRKQGKTTEKGAKIGLSEVKSNLDSPFFTVF